MPQKVITYRLTLEDPLILSIPKGDPNSAETLSYISGSSIVGALAGLWKKEASHDDSTLFQSLFLDGTVRYLNAYSEGEFDNRLLPPPLSLRVEKGTQYPVYDLADPLKEDILDEQDDQGLFRQLQPWALGYIRFSDEAIKYRTPSKTSRIHHQRDREFGRAREGLDAIFSYISMDAGERFIGHILLDDDTHLTVLQNLLQASHILLGRSKSAQYGGRASLTILSLSDGDSFLEAGYNSFACNDRITITLLSDYLGINTNGHITPDAFWFDLSNALGVNIENRNILDRYARIRPVSGYISDWKMPRPVIPAFQAGSIFIICIEEEIKPEKVLDLLWKGIGDRQVEGFGRIAINWHGQEGDDGPLKRTPEQDLLNELPAPDRTFPDQPDLFLLSRKRLLEQDMDQAVINAISNILEINKPSKIPSRALLGRLRELLRTASDTQDILDFLENCQEKPAGKQIERCRLDNHTLKEWLNKLFTDSNWLMQKFSMQNYGSLSNASARYFKKVQPTQIPDDVALLWSYRKRLADTVLQGLVRLSKEDSTT
jgi:CRISPR-associated protein Csx10